MRVGRYFKRQTGGRPAVSLADSHKVEYLIIPAEEAILTVAATFGLFYRTPSPIIRDAARAGVAAVTGTG